MFYSIIRIHSQYSMFKIYDNKKLCAEIYETAGHCLLLNEQHCLLQLVYFNIQTFRSNYFFLLMVKGTTFL